MDVEARGGGDAGSQTPGRSVTPIGCTFFAFLQEISLIHTTTTTSCLSSRVPFLLCHLSMEAGGQPSGAAQRRRQRRLRSWLTHERQSVAMALAEYTHHASRGQTRGPEPGREWSTRSTKAYGHRSLHSRGSGRVSRRSLSRGVGQSRSVTWLPRRPPLAVQLLTSAAGDAVDHPPVPPHARHQDEEGLGGGGEAGEGAGVGRTAPRQGPCRRASLCRRA